MGAANCTASGPEVDGITRVWCRRGAAAAHGALHTKNISVRIPRLAVTNADLIETSGNELSAWPISTISGYCPANRLS